MAPPASKASGCPQCLSALGGSEDCTRRQAGLEVTMSASWLWPVSLLVLAVACHRLTWSGGSFEVAAVMPRRALRPAVQGRLKSGRRGGGRRRAMRGGLAARYGLGVQAGRGGAGIMPRDSASRALVVGARPVAAGFAVLLAEPAAGC